MENQYEQIKKLLRKSFDLNYWKIGKINNQERYDMACALMSYDSKNFIRILAFLLENIMDSHNHLILGDVIIDENDLRQVTRTVTLFLDPCLEISENYIELMMEEFGEETASNLKEMESHISNSKEKTFSLVSYQQAHAIYNWLLLAKSWSAAEYGEIELDSAISYWLNRSSK